MKLYVYALLLFILIVGFCIILKHQTVREGLSSPPDKTGKAAASSSTMKCPSQFPHLLEYAPQKSYFCYQNPDGNTTGQGGLCNCNCSNCGFNNNFGNCDSLGASCAAKPQKCDPKWFWDSGTSKCVQTCPSDAQTRNADGRCKCGLGGNNQSCIDGTTCYKQECVAQVASGPCDPTKGQMSCCSDCQGDKLVAVGGTGLSATQFAGICKSRNSAQQCAAVGGTWKSGGAAVQLSTDVPIYISNKAYPGANKYLAAGGTGNEALAHSAIRKANFILRAPPGRNYPAKKPLQYTDVVCIQFAAVNNGGREIDQPNGNTSNCGWFGCRVLEPPNTTNSGINPTFGHGGPDPAIFMLMAPPSVVFAKGAGAPTAIQAKLPIHSGDPFCLQYAGTANKEAPVNWGFTGNCGWFGCRVLADYLDKEPKLGEFGWQHGGGTGAGNSPTSWPNGPTVFTIEMDAPTAPKPPPKPPAKSEDCCQKWVQTLNCKGDGPLDTGTAFKQSSTGVGKCTTSIPEGASGYCLCKDGTKKGMVDCGHAPFTCNDVCKDNCTAAPPKPPPPAPKPPPPPPAPKGCSLPSSFGVGVVGGGTIPCMDGSLLESGKNCDVKCDSGYKVLSGTSQYSCNNGELTRGTLQCGPINCKIPASLGKGIRAAAFKGCSPGSSLGAGKTCSVDCDAGYKGDGGAGTYSCSSAGVLSKAPLECNPVTCKLPRTFGRYVEAAEENGCKAGGTLLGGTNCNTVCTAGYKKYSGSGVFSCDENGVLDTGDLKCRKGEKEEKKPTKQPEEITEDVMIQNITFVCDPEEEPKKIPEHRLVHPSHSVYSPAPVYARGISSTGPEHRVPRSKTRYFPGMAKVRPYDSLMNWR